ncbi:MAG TPA: ROK family protein [Candidatus Eisenbacteria bacterium]|jgi:predicted NBD/HSP70 family sugar kinase|nr:ROK family protein [Candidatus Eisenbacteria bacterium]
MPKTVGVLVMEHIAVGLVEGNKLAAPPSIYPAQGSSADALLSMPAESIGERIKQQIADVTRGQKIEAIGLGFPGVIRNGVIEDSPNLHQVKGFRLQTVLSAAAPGDASVPVRVFNDADAMAAGIAASRDKLHKLIRVWTLGNGVGFGRYPWSEGVWEGGHSVVTLDPKETLCGCGGRGHLEGILGHRSMRLRFLDMEPEEVFANAASGDARCAEFVALCHRALAAATATSIHMDGPGHFYITGTNAKFIDIGMLDRNVQEMVKMSPLQGSRFEVIPTSDELGIIGAAVNARAAVQ